MSMTTKEVLVAAKALIDTPEKWTRKTYARTAKGWETTDMDTAAVCFCASGAVCRVTQRVNQNPALLELAFHSPGGNLIAFNDAPTTTHADIMALFDRAIAACE